MNVVNQTFASFINSKCPIPQGMTDPNEIIDYLLRSNKITQEQYNQARVQMQSMSQNGGLPSPEYVTNLLFRR